MRRGQLKIKLQVACGDSFAIGPGKAELLERIAEFGSISAAARAMGMSYRRAWLLVDEMNRCFVERVVATAPGGGPQGGARLTEPGTRVLAAFREIEREAGRVTEHPAYRVVVDSLRVEVTPGKSDFRPE